MQVLKAQTVVTAGPLLKHHCFYVYWEPSVPDNCCCSSEHAKMKVGFTLLREVTGVFGRHLS